LTTWTKYLIIIIRSYQFLSSQIFSSSWEHAWTRAVQCKKTVTRCCPLFSRCILISGHLGIASEGCWQIRISTPLPYRAVPTSFTIVVVRWQTQAFKTCQNCLSGLPFWWWCASLVAFCFFFFILALLFSFFFKFDFYFFIIFCFTLTSFLNWFFFLISFFNIKLVGN